MKRISYLLALLTVAGCASQAASGPARSTGTPFDVNDREVETPGSLPPGFTTNHPLAPSTGVYGTIRTAP